MKVLFIGSSSLGPRYIMGLLKRNGHQAIGIYQGVNDCLGEPSAGFSSPISLKDLSFDSFEKTIGDHNIDTKAYIRI